ncbi:MAG: hypothetical protein M3174_01180 [Actinomycetota bacterium]|nr:hypothetical protein [Actinomycetota bacterium]
MLSRKATLALAAISLCLVNLAVTLVRSTIPISIEGTIERIEFLSEENPGIDDIYVLHVDGAEIHVDREVARRLVSNVHVSKDAWSTEMTVGRYEAARTVDLAPSEDFAGMTLTMPIVLGVLLIALYARRDEPAPTPQA